jgi:arylsulfatase A-like enzyme
LAAALARVDGEQAFAFLAAAAARGDVTAADLDYLRGLYDSEVRMADYELGRVLAAVAESGLADETLVVVTSDHGEAFLEHGQMVHGTALYPEMLRVPLVIHLPGQRQGVRVGYPVQNVDVMPTVLDAVGLPVPREVQGRIRLPGLDRGPAPVFSEASFGTRLARVAEGRFAFLADPEATAGGRLFDRDDDPLETRDAAPQFPRAARRLRGELDGFLRQNARERSGLAREAPVLSQEMRERVRALGYAN